MVRPSPSVSVDCLLDRSPCSIERSPTDPPLATLLDRTSPVNPRATQIRTLVLALPFALASMVKAADARPNFLFLLADDWGWGDVGAYGANGDWHHTGTNTRTPTLDALAANGTLFTDFHTGQSFCAPSRTAFMTGKFPADLSVNTNWCTGGAEECAPQNHRRGLPYQLPTPAGDGPSPFKGGLVNTPSLLQKAGYATAHYGKWHLGGCSPPGEHTPSPSEYGFDHTGTYGSPVFAHCVNETAKDEIAGHGMTNQSDKWFSSDVGDYIKEKGIAHMKKAVANKQVTMLVLLRVLRLAVLLVC